MQYPIIDLITSAYINNGWTGLDISTGKNLLNVNVPVYVIAGNVPSSVDISSDVGQITITENYYDRNRNKFGWKFNVNQDTDYVASGLIQSSAAITIKIYTDDGTVIFNSNYSQNALFSSVFNSGSNTTLYFYATITSWGQTINIIDLQIEEGTTRTPYEPYSEPKNDFPNRLKLPMIHYFPHPVIDSLKRASEGTMTNKDREILTHYLTPLGIGGI